MENLADGALGSRYIVLDRIGAGGMGVVYRVQDRLNDTPVALKLISHWRGANRVADSEIYKGETDIVQTKVHGGPSVVYEHPSASKRNSSFNSEESRLALAHEFRLLASLRHPHIISVLDYGFDQTKRPFYTMELLQDAFPMSTYLQGLSLQEKVDILAQLLSALTYLHRRGVVHRDIKPENALVTQNRHVKLLDFGVAMLRDPTQPEQQDVAGTVAYMAPELFRGAPASEQSDLFAVGVLAAEVFIGRHPLCSGPNATDYVSAALWNEPQLDGAGLSDALLAVLLRLLAKKPQDRFQSAEEATRQLFAATGRDPPIETQAERESFLQAARFIGRREELSQLQSALLQAVEGTGSAWLVGGESGVGKTRLLSELRAQALVRGLLVLRGQAMNDIRSPLLAFREILRELCLHVQLGALEASVLKAILPDLSRLLGQPVADAPPLEAKAAQERLLSVVEDVLGRASQPMLLVLDDAQWIDSESLALLERLVRRIAPRRWVLVLSYRDDENPQLPSTLPGAQVISLKRLNPAEIKTLVGSMLGAQSARPELVNLLAHESEGNTYFLVEAVRELAVRSGGFRNVVEMSPPSKVFSGGIRAAVDRRLERVPVQMRPLLRLAAIAGRRIDPSVLSAMQTNVDVNAFIRTCSEVAVLDIAEQQWQFAHDKLRERILEQVSSEDRKKAHLLVAQATERAYPKADHLAGLLAYHYQEAQRLDLATPYAARAGALALQSGALHEAIRQLTTALSYYDGRTTDSVTRARLRRQLVAAYNGLGQLKECIEACLAAWADLGHPMPSSRKVFLASLVPHLYKHAAALLTKATPAAPQPEEIPRLREIIELAKTAAIPLFFLGRTEEVFLSIFHLLEAADRLGSQDDLVAGLMGLAYMASMVPSDRLTRLYVVRSAVHLHGCHEASLLIFYRTVSVIHLHAGRWHQGRQAAERCIQYARSTGNFVEECFGVLQIVCVHLFVGRIEQTRVCCDQLARVSERTDNSQFLMWADGVRGFLAFERGESDKALQILARTNKRANETHDVFGMIYATGVTALTLLQKGQLKEAEEAADQTMQYIRSVPMVVSAILDGYPAPAEVYLTLWRQQGYASDALRHKARDAIQWLIKYSRPFAMGRPRAQIWPGVLAVLEGHRRKGLSRIEQGIAEAVWRDQPRDEAIGRYQLALALGPSDPTAYKQLQHAADLLDRIEAIWRRDKARSTFT